MACLVEILVTNKYWISLWKVNTVQTPTAMASLVEMLVTNRCWISLWKEDEYSADPNMACLVEMLVTNRCWISLWKDEYSADPSSHGKSCRNFGDKQMLNKSLKGGWIQCSLQQSWQVLGKCWWQTDVEQVVDRMNTVHTPTVLASLVEMYWQTDVDVFVRMNTVHTPTVMASPVEMLLINRCWISLWKGRIQCRPQQSWQVLRKCWWQTNIE